MGFFFEEIFHFAKTTEFSLSVATGTDSLRKRVIRTALCAVEERER